MCCIIFVSKHQWIFMFVGGDYNMQKYEIDKYKNLLKTIYNDLNNIFLETPESCCQICIYKDDYCDDCNCQPPQPTANALKVGACKSSD